jgi:hypothetical protein
MCDLPKLRFPPVPEDLLRELAAEAQDEAKQAKAAPAPSSNGHANGNGEYRHRLDVPRWLQARGVDFRQRDQPDSRGRTVYVLKQCPFDAGHGDPDSCIMQEPNGKLSAQCFHNSCQGRGWQDFKEAIGKPDGDHYDPPMGRRRVSRKRSGPTAVLPDAPPGEDGGCTASPGTRPKIVITTEEHEVNAEAAGALAADPSLYQRGGLLVRVVRDDAAVERGIRRPVAPRIDPLPQPILRERLAERAEWVRLRETKDGIEERPAHPPAWSVSAVHLRTTYPGVRHLEAIVDHPVLRPDGTILCQPGYDAQTGLIFEADADLSEVVAGMNGMDPRAARDVLLEAVVDFPFDRPEHRSAWLAALLTPLARFAFCGPAPLFLADANVPGAGKGLLLHLVVKILRDSEFTVCTYTQDEDELRKRIFSLALAGERLVLFDNLEGHFGCATLDAALTATSFSDRVLGVSRTASAPLLMTWYATGNNVAVGADTARRICHLRLESPEERPEEKRGFRHPKLLAWASQNRPRLLAAALAILRGYCEAGRPDMNLAAWGSFEGWSALVRSAVVWSGLPDPGLTRLLLQERSDTVVECMGAILACWERMDPSRSGLTAADVVQQLYPRQTKDAATPPAWHGDFRAALESLLGRPDGRALGNKLRSYRRRLFKGRYIDRVGTDHQAARWGVFHRQDFNRASPPAGESRESGESVSPVGRNETRPESGTDGAHPAWPWGEKHSPHSPDSPPGGPTPGEGEDGAGPFTTPWD